MTPAEVDRLDALYEAADYGVPVYLRELHDFQGHTFTIVGAEGTAIKARFSSRSVAEWFVEHMNAWPTISTALRERADYPDMPPLPHQPGPELTVTATNFRSEKLQRDYDPDGIMAHPPAADAALREREDKMTADDDLPGMLALARGVAEQRFPHTIDARVWADEWAKTIAEHPGIPTDSGTMLGWFANAIMAGYDTAQMRERAQPSAEPGYVKVNTGQPIKCPVQPDGHCYNPEVCTATGTCVIKCPVQPDGHCYNPEVCTATGTCVIHGSMPVQHPPAADAPQDDLLREIDLKLAWPSTHNKELLQRARDRIAAMSGDARSQAQDMARQNIRIAELERALAEREKPAAGQAPVVL